MVAKSDNSGLQAAARKAYRKPTLAKVAVLSAITAQQQTSHTAG
jgi:hypothetical protein